MLIPEPGAFYVMDRGFLDFEWLYAVHQAGSFFVIRAQSNMKFERRYSRPAGRAAGIICDQIGRLTGTLSSQHYPHTLRRIRIKVYILWYIFLALYFAYNAAKKFHYDSFRVSHAPA
ncbi:Transposase [Ferriphaselus amnicola]|uniref:Transposase n=1 Tax=Ferriphaselus amnicola TaxID=1188319 RepID=A0A2Z6GCK9_9PROT|nr:Transposase [Ferriphaselus amnicola]